MSTHDGTARTAHSVSMLRSQRLSRIEPRNLGSRFEAPLPSMVARATTTGLIEILILSGALAPKFERRDGVASAQEATHDKSVT